MIPYKTADAGLLGSGDLQVDTKVSEEHNATIFGSDDLLISWL
jgi:hypothetical protein